MHSLLRVIIPAALLAGSALAAAPAAGAQSLRGSRHAVRRVWHYAHRHDYAFARTSRGVRRAVHDGTLVRLHPNGDYELHEVSFPYTTPATRRFVTRLAAQYHAYCGEPLVVTSAVRPTSVQPANASEYSVHPTGIAVDLRRPESTRCAAWLRRNLLILEKRGVLDATEEHHPAHFHVAVYAAAYREYLASR